MKYSNIPSAQTIIEHCRAKGVKNIVLSPGSRNAPLTISFTENSFFTCFSIVDERCAAFFALGMAQQLKEPVAVVCTSGSALLNYYPAVAEAFYSDIPLVVISADRPLYKIDIGDGQTIRQTNVFANHIGYSANLKQDVSHAVAVREKLVLKNEGEDVVEVQNEVQLYNDSELNTALNMALIQNTPVHINVPFEEPLYGKTNELSIVPNIVFKEQGASDSDFVIEDFKETWENATRIMVLVGVNAPNTIEANILEKLGKNSRVLVLTETTSNLYHPNFFPSIDSILAPIEKSKDKEELFKELQPDILLTFGGLVVSKKIKSFLRDYSPKQHWHVDEQKAFNTYFCLSNHIKIDPNTVLKAFLGLRGRKESSYFAFWNKRRKNYENRKKTYVKEVAFSDFLVFEKVLGTIPNGYKLQLSNSSTIRYAQLFNRNPTVSVFCNRGTSGIDGSTSTAIGASICTNAPTLLITGDLSFFYDSNGLWNSYVRNDFRIIIINNEGGGIFRILPGKEDTESYSTYFETSHSQSAKELSTMYGLEYALATDEESLVKILEHFYLPSEKSKILEIKTPRLLNNKILLGYFDFIS